MPKYEVTHQSNIKIDQIIQYCKCSDVYLRVISSSDGNVPIKFTASLIQGNKEVVSTDTVSNGPWVSPSLSPGNFELVVQPISAKSFPDFIPRFPEKGFVFDLSLEPNATALVTISFSRKESIIYDIAYDFLVEDAGGGDSSEPVYELRAFGQVSENAARIPSSSKAFGVEERLIKSIMYMETTHGYYDVVLAAFDKNKSILPMNVNVEYWSKIFTREQLEDEQKNIDAGALMLRRITDRLLNPTPRIVATLYNYVNAKTVTDYGARVGKIYENREFLPPRTLLHKIHQDLSWFENLSPEEQISALRRIFGGY